MVTAVYGGVKRSRSVGEGPENPQEKILIHMLCAVFVQVNTYMATLSSK